MRAAVSGWLATFVALVPLVVAGQTRDKLEQQRFERVANGVRDREQGVIWAARDNGSDVHPSKESNVTWQQASAYCSGLGAGWSLPSVAQLLSLWDETGAFAKKIDGRTITPATDQIQFTSLWYWSAETNGSAEAWSVAAAVLLHGSVRNLNPMSNAYGHRALCVRRS